MQASTRKPATRVAEGIVWGVGAALCLVQFVARRSLWVDELAIVRNVTSRDVAGLLTRPLDNDQVAPTGFLLAQQALSRLPIDGEVSMRLYALVLSLVAIALVVRLARTELRGWCVVVPPLAFGISAQTTWLAAQAKPYASDACITAALILAAFTVTRWRSSRRGIAFVAALALVAPWFSLTTVFVLPSLLLSLLAHDRTEGRRRRPSNFTIAFAMAAVVSALAAVVVSRWHVAPSTMRFMQEFWRESFPDATPDEWIDLKWPLFTLRQLVRSLTNGVGSYAYLTIVLLGAWSLTRRDRVRGAVVLLPFGLALFAAALRLYPVADRLGFFLFPLLALLLGIGADQLAHFLRDRRAPAFVTVGVLAPSALWLVLHAPPFAIEHTRPLLEVMRREARPGDVVYVPYGSWQAWSYYSPRLGLDWLPARVGVCHGADMNGYAEEMRDLKAYRRTWILFVPTGLLRSASFVTALADNEGEKLGDYRVSTHDAMAREREVELYLYDFGGASVAPDSAATWRRAVARERSADGCHGAAIPIMQVQRAGDVESLR